MEIKSVKKKSKYLVPAVILAVLAAAFSVLLPIYIKHNKPKADLYKEERISISAFGTELGKFSADDLYALAPPTDFIAVYKPSGKAAITKTYNGIFLKTLLEALGIDLNTAEFVRFSASDGIEKAYSAADIREEGNVYIAALVDGKPFNKGLDPFAYGKPEEDGGPFVVIKAYDGYSMNRVKLLVQIEVL